MFYFNEGNPREPVHIHALKNGVDAKFWLWPDAVVATNDGYSAKTLRELIEIIEKHRPDISGAWNEFFG